MIKLRQAVVVEGKYDQIKLSGIIDAPIITTDGFGIFKNREKAELIRRLAQTRGIIILTDSDSAGFMIRRRIRECAGDGQVINVYIPDVFGKEKRKKQGSKEGKLGVEGLNDGAIISALERAGVFAQKSEREPSGQITKTDLYFLGLSGTPNAQKNRRRLLKKLQLPENMSPKLLLDTLNIFYTKDEFMKETAEFFDGGN